MDLSDLQAQWRQENEMLKARVDLNEQLVRGMKIEKALDEFHRLLKTSIAGRNLALFYAAISMALAAVLGNEIIYSLPALVGAGAMIWSFMHHLTIKKPRNYDDMSIVELQKIIEQFRVHSLRSLNADLVVMVLWLYTLIPAGFRVVAGVQVYSSPRSLIIFGALTAGIVFWMQFIARSAYRTYNQKLKQSQAVLESIKAFEQG